MNNKPNSKPVDARDFKKWLKTENGVAFRTSGAKSLRAWMNAQVVEELSVNLSEK